MTPTPTSGAAIQPVLWVSPEQFANFMDADEAQFGRYVPARKTSAGNFTMPLFAAPAQPAAQQGAAYAALPTSSYAGRVYEEGFLIGTCPLYTADQLHAFADATHTLRASHGQAPADAKALAEADRRAGEAERLLATCKEDVMRFEQVRSRMKYQWGAEQRVSFDEVWDEALALKKAAQAAPQAADSVTAPAPPPECETEAEKRAFAFGWFKALESERMKADNKKKDPL